MSMTLQHVLIIVATCIDALFLDLAKAFDKVPYQRLCLKLSHCGINGNILTWIKDFLITDTKQCY